MYMHICMPIERIRKAVRIGRACVPVACFGADCSSEYLLASRMQARDSVVRVTKSERSLSLSLKIFMNNA